MKDCANFRNPKPFTGGDASIKLRDLSSLQRGDNLPSSDGRVKLRCLVKSLPGGRDLLSLGRGPRGRHRGDIGRQATSISWFKNGRRIRRSSRIKIKQKRYTYIIISTIVLPTHFLVKFLPDKITGF